MNSKFLSKYIQSNIPSEVKLKKFSENLISENNSYPQNRIEIWRNDKLINYMTVFAVIVLVEK